MAAVHVVGRHDPHQAVVVEHQHPAAGRAVGGGVPEHANERLVGADAGDALDRMGDLGRSAVGPLGRRDLADLAEGEEADDPTGAVDDRERRAVVAQEGLLEHHGDGGVGAYRDRARGHHVVDPDPARGSGGQADPGPGRGDLELGPGIGRVAPQSGHAAEEPQGDPVHLDPAVQRHQRVPQLVAEQGAEEDDHGRAGDEPVLTRPVAGGDGGEVPAGQAPREQCRDREHASVHPDGDAPHDAQADRLVHLGSPGSRGAASPRGILPAAGAGAQGLWSRAVPGGRDRDRDRVRVRPRCPPGGR